MKGATSPCRSPNMAISPRRPAMHLMPATRICLGAATQCRSAVGCLQRVLLMRCASGSTDTVLAGGPREGREQQ